MVDLFKQIITGVPGRRGDCLSSFKITAMLHLAFLGVWFGVMLEAGLFIGVTFPVPDFGSSLLAFGGRTADELIISLIAHRLNRRTYYKDTEWEEEF